MQLENPLIQKGTMTEMGKTLEANRIGFQLISRTGLEKKTAVGTVSVSFCLPAQAESIEKYIARGRRFIE